IACDRGWRQKLGKQFRSVLGHVEIGVSLERSVINGMNFCFNPVSSVTARRNRETDGAEVSGLSRIKPGGPRRPEELTFMSGCLSSAVVINRRLNAGGDLPVIDWDAVIGGDSSFDRRHRECSANRRHCAIAPDSVG